MMDSLRRYIMPGTPRRIVERYQGLSARAAASNFGEYDSNVVILDTETTGVSFKKDELTQIAAARLEGGAIVDWYVTFVNPGMAIDEDVVALTGITDEMVADAPSPAEALSGLVDFVGDAKIVAHNAAFDRTFTTNHPAGYPLLENLWIDSLDLARIALVRLTSHRLIDLTRAFDTARSSHRADDDVAATAEVYRVLLAAVDAMPDELIGAIAALDEGDRWPTVEVFRFFARRRDVPIAPMGLMALRRTVVDQPTRKRREDGAGVLADDAIDAEGLTVAERVANALPQWNFPTAEAIRAAFEPGGIVSSLYETYEERPEQVAMAEAVANAFASSENLVVEAGTGVGKSMAYSVPAAMLTAENPIAVGIATKTNTLLDQLVYRELPTLMEALNADAPIAALKGFSHYPCLLRVEAAARTQPGVREVKGQTLAIAPPLAAVLSFIEQTDYDDIDGLKIDYRALPRPSITTTSYECLRRRCPFYGSACFVHGSRLAAESAAIVVTNHALLLRDLVSEGGLLPPIRYWVIDEAHGIEEEARSAFALTLSAEDLREMAGKLSSTESGKTVFDRAERIVRADEDLAEPMLFLRLEAQGKSAGAAWAACAREFVDMLPRLLTFDRSRQGRSYETVELWINDDVRASDPWADLRRIGQRLQAASEQVIKTAQELVGYLESVKSAGAIQREIASIAMRARDGIRAIDTIVLNPTEAYVYAAILARKGEHGLDRLEALPYDVGPSLNETLFAQTHSVVLTSATLAIGESFESFTDSVGIGSTESSAARTLALPSSYDFDSQMRIYVVSDLPEPGADAYLSKLEALLIELHRVMNGSMLTLFTNRREMEKAYDEIAPVLRGDDLRLVCQRWGVSVKTLRDDFLRDERLSLFALKSFWEGFDAPGSTLRGVAIAKLPFAKPTDPLSCERMARDDAAWRRYVLPKAVRETQQAAGRLIRTADDRGIIVLADSRLVRRSYGKTFLRSLPSKDVRILRADEIIADLKADNVFS